MTDWTHVPELTRPGGTKYGIREHVIRNLDAAIETVQQPGERLMWEITHSTAPVMTPQGPAMQMNSWLILTCPSPILGEGSITSAGVCDLRGIADNSETALAAVRQLVNNLRQAKADKLNTRKNGT